MYVNCGIVSYISVVVKWIGSVICNGLWKSISASPMINDLVALSVRLVQCTRVNLMNRLKGWERELFLFKGIGD